MPSGKILTIKNIKHGKKGIFPLIRFLEFMEFQVEKELVSRKTWFYDCFSGLLCLPPAWGVSIDQSVHSPVEFAIIKVQLVFSSLTYLLEQSW